MDVEVPLPGGNVGGAVLVGSTVRRPTGPWTPAVHELLGFLQAAGLRAVPRVHGFDEQGREVLDYLPGEVVPVGERALTDAQLASAARWLRDFHAVVAGFDRGPRRWRFVERALAPGEIVCHHDAAMYNLAFDGDELVGVFDWDVAGPGVPLDDLAILAWVSPLLFPDDDAGRMAHGLRVIADAYGDVEPARLLRHVERRMRDAADRIAGGQRAGDAGMLRLGEIGEPAATLARLEVLVARTDEIVDALGR
ncbi:phosphotransferase [Cellulomonas sp. DKR-3]|uniref:Phosphotransferase n=1 Tax=Cellulomonas fulva TaxID=2835530 RepID=A0ABS5TUF9_9CELL|nr:aminoglycoside phosphotransferase family protein [Cellulomonas fulva]MBT0992778.1 phosphotransferase [Cellulomonas fulva]